MPRCAVTLTMLGLALGALPIRSGAQPAPVFRFGFQYILAGTPIPQTVAANGVIPFGGTNLGSTTSVTLMAENQGESIYDLASAEVTGTAFRLSPLSFSPITPGSSYPIPLTFTPAAVGTASGRLDLVFTTTAGTVAVRISIFLSGTGLQANLVTSYLLPSSNQAPLGDSIEFPVTAVRESSTAVVIVSNTGNGAGTLRSASVSGEGFSLAGLPLLPATIAAQGETRFNVIFTPLSRTAATGTLRFDIGNGTRTVQLRGTPAAAVLSYDATTDSGTQTLSPDTPYRLQDTAVGSSATVAVRILNNGNADARVVSIAIAGAGYTLAKLPPLPATVAAGKSVRFDLVFAPTTFGPASGELFIDGAAFALSGVGLGERLVLSVDFAGVQTQVPADGIVTFPSTVIGTRSTLAARVLNTGNAPGTVRSAFVSGSAFALTRSTALPAVLNAGESLTLSLQFAPESVGPFTGLLQVDGATYALRGAGAAPPQMPSASISAPSTSEALQQPTVGLSLASAYPLDLTGRLTLSFAGVSAVDDPAIQFASGGRTVEFRIPANTRGALFGSATSTQIQTGTVAGTVTFTASFQVGTVDLTPSPAPTSAVQIAASAPKLLNVQVGAQNAGGFELLVTGYANTRQVTSMSFDFQPAAGTTLQSTSASYNADSVFSAWFQSTGSRTYGGQFTASVFINVNGKIADIQSVAVRANNQLGTSQAVSVNLR